jgi:hypothetical protein
VFKTFIKYSLLVIWGSLILSCNKINNPDKITVAEVGVKKLYLSKIADVIPDELDKNDSALMADDYIKKWIKQELLILKAEENLTMEQKNLTEELQEYRNSLIIYKYKNELMKQKMDTTVTDDQILEYYTENEENFKLTKNIVKAIFIKIPTEFANPRQLKNYCNDTSEGGLNELREYCFQYAKGFDIFIDNWVDFDVVLKNIPKEISEPEQFLPRNNLIELNDSNYYYLVRIHDFKLKNEIAPAEYVTENIKNLILNRRKIAFLKQIEDNIYTEGIRSNKFKIYNQKTDELEQKN